MDFSDIYEIIKVFFVHQGYKILIIFISGLLFLKLTDLFSGKIVYAMCPPKKRKDAEFLKRLDTLSSVIHYVITFVIVIVAGLMILKSVGVEIGPLLATAGVMGIAVGLGAQSLVKDIISGFFIFLEDQIRVGDVVQIAGKSGVVERMNFKFTILRDLSGNVHYVPNGEITVVTNMTKVYSRYVLDIGVAYRENVDEVMDIMREVDENMRNDEEFGPDIIEPIEILGVEEFSDSAVVVRGRVTTKPIKQWRVAREFRRRLKIVFDERNVEIPFPHVTLYAGKDKDNQSPPLNIQLDSTQP